MGLELLDEAGAGIGPAVIVGENLPVVRYCCDAGRLRRPQLHAILDAQMGRRGPTATASEHQAFAAFARSGAESSSVPSRSNKTARWPWLCHCVFQCGLGVGLIKYGRAYDKP